mgnify:CR=1 FL=1
MNNTTNYRIFVEKLPRFRVEAESLRRELNTNLNLSLGEVRLLCVYDLFGFSEELLEKSRYTVFGEVVTDSVTDTFDLAGRKYIAVEYLPGQFDQRAASAVDCVRLIDPEARVDIRSSRLLVFDDKTTDGELAKIRHYYINAVESREKDLSVLSDMEQAEVKPVGALEGFREMADSELEPYCKTMGLAMNADDLREVVKYFRSEGRDPYETELRILDTYWSDHCRHTTFTTELEGITVEESFVKEEIEDSLALYLRIRRELGREHKSLCLMDMATIGARYLRQKGLLDDLEVSEENNACSVYIDVDVDGRTEKWLLQFKNETHNHPTEIEPFGGASTCLGGAIRDPLSGRSYVYQAMRVTGAGNIYLPVSETLSGKLPQSVISKKAAAGYSSYGNQIGLATTHVREIYHDDYVAKRLEVGAVVGAVKAANVRRERPAPGDKIIMFGGRTGRDGIGGATGSSKEHDAKSLETCGSEVQKGNAPEERKLQRLFRNGEASRLIKRCNDFGAGGVSVAIGELADGLEIDLNAVPKKYDGLDGTELAISESQERMAVVVEAKDAARFLELAATENLNAVPVAVVTESPRLVMNWNGKKICDISREFLNSNGAAKHMDAAAEKAQSYGKAVTGSFAENFLAVASDLNTCSKRGLSERFDSTIGAGTVLMPFGGKYQLTPIQAMVQKISVEKMHTDDCSFMAFGYNPFITSASPYHGAYLAVVESVCKLIASGASFEDTYLTFQEYFERLGKDPKRWGKPLAALLGAFRAQMELGIGAIGGKDSMSGSFEKLDVPPTLVSFAVTTGKTGEVVSPEFKAAGHKVCLLTPAYDENGLPETASLLETFDTVTKLLRSGRAVAAYTPGMGGIAEAVMKMGFGNGLGFAFDDALTLDELFGYTYGSFVLEMADGIVGKVLGVTTADGSFSYHGEALSQTQVLGAYEDKLESVYACNIPTPAQNMETFSYEATQRKAPAVKVAKPKVLIPAFPGTNCEYDSAKAVRDAGAEPEIIVINNLSADGIARSVERFANELKTAQMVFIPGGFSGGDEPDGSGKFITAFFRNAAVKEGVTALLEQRDGLMCGICNGFQALIKLGLVPYGKIIDTDETCPTLTFNNISRHQSRIVRTRVASNKSPWLALTNVGDVYNVPISHGEGKFLASEELIRQLAANGQIATQYVDLDGNATADVHFNPNGSLYAIEGITSPDGRVFGKMGHSERIGSGLYKNVPGEYNIRMFEAAVKYFR